MSLLPIFCQLQGKRCLVVGGGAVALRKTRSLVESHADILVIAPHFCDEMYHLAQHGKITLKESLFSAYDMQDCWLVVAATNDPKTNRTIARLAEAQHIFCNVADAPEIASFMTPCRIKRDPVVIAISTSGCAPVYSQYLKQLIESTLPTLTHEIAQLAGSLRAEVKTRLLTAEEKTTFWRCFFANDELHHAIAHRDDFAIEHHIEALFTTSITTHLDG